ncbi:YjzD family protein [Neobacillus sp. PS3-12]|uniref:YjzD family protein n=1 Tax=Neobacillus sp. PS3-12 TaxID=3070677 RepID=UPI0027DF369D|nr:YjzD family protein [Neobacillus sp. PS3-12]WML51570.1 YjzD family protein [Neobacillus sp. PS3-12]
MRYFWSLFWGFLLVQMLTYVVSSMIGTTYDFKMGTILTVVLVVMVYAISALIPNEPAEKH